MQQSSISVPASNSGRTHWFEVREEIVPCLGEGVSFSCGLSPMGGASAASLQAFFACSFPGAPANQMGAVCLDNYPPLAGKSSMRLNTIIVRREA